MRGSRTIYKDGKVVAEYNSSGELVSYDREYWTRNRSDLAAPMIMKDIGEYRSPIDNSMITSRSVHRDHMRQHDVIEVGNEGIRAPVEDAVSTKDIGEEIKRRIEEVKALPEATYQEHVHTQRCEHEAIGDLAVAS